MAEQGRSPRVPRPTSSLTRPVAYRQRVTAGPEARMRDSGHHSLRASFSSTHDAEPATAMVRRAGTPSKHGKYRRTSVLALAVLLLATACTQAPAPHGDALFAAGAEHYDRFATGLHSVLMAVHEDTWTVEQKDFGVAPITCGGEDGYSFHAIRAATPTNAEPDELAERAIAAAERLDLDVTSTTFGSGSRAQLTVVAAGGAFDRLVVTISPANGNVLVTASSACADGNASELGDLVFAQSRERDQWRLLPAAEGPDFVPQFYFPPDGPVYYTEDGTPVDPQPTVTDRPVAPYGQ